MSLSLRPTWFKPGIFTEILSQKGRKEEREGGREGGMEEEKRIRARCGVLVLIRCIVGGGRRIRSLTSNSTK